jgi:hypothetical protein
MPSTLASRIERLEVDDGAIVILRGCRHCGAMVPGNPALSPCGQHPPAPAGKIVTIERAYGQPARLH